MRGRNLCYRHVKLPQHVRIVTAIATLGVRPADPGWGASLSPGWLVTGRPSPLLQVSTLHPSPANRAPHVPRFAIAR